jgi:hypothetical protein
MPSARSCLALALFLTACGAPAQAPAPRAAGARPLAAASALDGVVRALEALAAARPADCVVEVRALEAEVRIDPATRGEQECVTLDLSVFAPTVERAYEAYDELRLALVLAGATAPRAERATPERVRRALFELGSRPGGEALLSYSDRMRVELLPGAGAPPAGAPASEEDVAGEAVDSATLESYVRTRASEVRSVGQVDIQRIDRRPNGPREGVRVLLEPAMEFQRFRTDQIGAFLAELDQDSPAVRVTQLAIARSSHEPDTRNPRGWTFTAELTVRAPDGGT